MNRCSDNPDCLRRHLPPHKVARVLAAIDRGLGAAEVHRAFALERVGVCAGSLRRLVAQRRAAGRVGETGTHGGIAPAHDKAAVPNQPVSPTPTRLDPLLKGRLDRLVELTDLRSPEIDARLGLAERGVGYPTLRAYIKRRRAKLGRRGRPGRPRKSDRFVETRARVALLMLEEWNGGGLPLGRILRRMVELHAGLRGESDQ